MIYVCYATANEKRFFLDDIDNLSRLAHQPHGMPKIRLLIAISEVRHIASTDIFFTNQIKTLFAQHPSIELQDIFFKSNSGRDFSSYAAMLRKVQQTAHADDYIFFTNRSARGPFLPNWLKQFVDQHAKFPQVGLCGSTINLSGHIRRNGSTPQPHVQSYNLLAHFKHLQGFIDAFPAEHENDRTRIIDEGEIGLSTAMLNAGLGLTCMEWPDTLIHKELVIPEILPKNDIKKSVKRPHAFYHRLYLKKHRMLPVSWYGLRYLWRYAWKQMPTPLPPR